MRRTHVTRWLQVLGACGFGIAAAHPLDPLTADEIVGAASVLLSGGAAQPGAIFQSVELREPPKAAVLGGGSGDRQATVFWRQNKQSFKSTVNLRAGSFTRPQLIPRAQGQLGLTITEVVDFSFAFQDPAFLQALALVGIGTPQQLQQVLDSGVVPVPTATHEFDEASVGALVGLRPPLKPLRVTQPDGTNFRIDGNFVEWQKWRFHVRFERRAGPVVSLATYGGRSVLYQGSMAEIFVPYQDPGANWYYRAYMDEGEFGFGLLASPLTPRSA